MTTPMVEPMTASTVIDSGAVLLTITEAAQWLRIGRTLTYELVMTGQIESVTIGRLRRVPFECLTDYVQKLRTGIRQNSHAA